MILGVVAGVDDAMILAEQLATRVFRNLAELVIHVGDRAALIGGRDDRRLVEGVADLVEAARVNRPSPALRV